MKKWIKIAGLLALMLPVAVPAEDYNYTINGSNITITRYTGPGGAVVIPSNIVGRTVTSIGDWAFWGCNSLTGVIIPNSVTSIGDWAFRGCNSLTSVIIPNSVTSIGDGAFCECINLASVTIPSGVTSIGREMFAHCESLASIIIPAGVTNIGSSVFDGCASLTSITVPASVTNIGSSVFDGCASLLAISVDANNPFYSSASGVLFNKTKTLLIQCPGGKTGSYTIPDSVISLGYTPFVGCLSLSAITAGENNSDYSSVNGVLFNKDQTVLVAYPGGKSGSYTIPSNVTEIGVAAFGICPNLTGITIPRNVTIIGDSAFDSCSKLTSVVIPDSVTSLGQGAFSPCSSLLSITVDTNNVFYSSVDGVLFNKTKAMLIQYPTGKVGSYTIPDFVTDIGQEAFRESDSLSNITIPSSVTNIGVKAFRECKSLTSVSIGSGVTNIQESAFRDCKSLTSVSIGSRVTNIQQSAFRDCPSLTSITIPASVASIGQWVFDQYISQVYFQGNAPSGINIFNGNNNAIIYYLPGTTGWGTTFDYRPTVAWNPQIQTGEANFGVQSNRFCFTITGDTNFAVKVEACTNLAEGVWVPVETNTLTGGSVQFSDPAFTNYPNRYYRVSMPQ